MNKNKSYKHQLDKIQRQQTIKMVLGIILISGALIGLYIIWLLYAATEKSEIVSGKALALVDSTNAQKLEVFIVVELTGGKIVQARIPTPGKFQKGKVVFLTEYSTKAFGAKRYHFLKFQEPLKDDES